METTIKEKWNKESKADGESTIISQEKNIQAALSMIKSMATDATISSLEQNIKEIGAAEWNME